MLELYMEAKEEQFSGEFLTSSPFTARLRVFMGGKIISCLLSSVEMIAEIKTINSNDSVDFKEQKSSQKFTKSDDF